MIGRIWRALLSAGPIRLWALILAGPPLTVFAAWLVLIVWKGPWPDRLAGQQLTILGYGLFGAMALIGIIVIALASVKVKGAGPAGFNFEVDGGDDDAPTSARVRTTTETEILSGAGETGELPPDQRVNP